MDIEGVFKKVLDCSFTVHSFWGPGLLDKVYKECLVYELKDSGIIVERQKPYPLVYTTIRLEVGCGVDLIVENQVIVVIKS